MTGGEREHTLTIDEIPAHSHDTEVPFSGEVAVLQLDCNRLRLPVIQQ